MPKSHARTVTPTRRAFLVGAAGAGVALAGCGGTSNAGGVTTPTAGATGDQSSAATNGLAKTSDIPLGGGAIFASQKVVVTQPSTGQFKAFSATCTHAQCTVGRVQDGTIVCPCHGSRFSIKDGSVQNGPATQPLTARPITVEGDNLVLG
jgi:nitrite reductase/ring-hydroxylating ferredoxin subunit